VESSFVGAGRDYLPAILFCINNKPRKPDVPLLSAFMIWRILFVSLIMVTGSFGLFLWERSLGTSIEEARTVTVNTLVMFEIFYVFNSRYLYHSVLNLHGLFGNRLVWLAILLIIILQTAFTYWQPMQVLFGTVALDAHTWQMIVASPQVCSYWLKSKSLSSAFICPKRRWGITRNE